ncbi:MAG TPA: DUF6084 family protein [Rugosimonospora sp.]|nr:DUF6084 family protein [Rugosimonospora sp.]
MTELTFACLGARAEQYAAAPTLTFRLRITEDTGAVVHAIALRCQIRIEPQQRRYGPQEAERLADLFGDVSRWADTLKPIQFTTVTTIVPAFTGTVDVDLPVPCTYDLEVAAARYFYGLQDDVAPLLMLFSGTVFTKNGDGLSVQPVSWSAECGYRLPVAVWREMVDRYFPGSGWIRLDRDTLDALARYKSTAALPTWDATVSALLEKA